MRYKDKIVMVTGAGRGIGKALCIDFAKEGAKIIAASRTEGELRDLERQIGSKQIMILPTDLTSEDQIKRLIDESIKKFEKIDVLINNAGIGYHKKVVDLPTDEWNTMMDVNLRGVFFCCKYALPGMIKRTQGTIVNVASLAGKNFYAGGAGYCATKWGLLGFSKCLMQEVREYNIRVLVVCPGSVDTTFHTDSGQREKVQKPMLKPEDVSQVILDTVALPERATVSELEIRVTKT